MLRAPRLRDPSGPAQRAFAIVYEAGWHLTPDQGGTTDTEDFATAVIDALGRRSESQNYTEATMQAPSQLPSENGSTLRSRVQPSKRCSMTTDR